MVYAGVVVVRTAEQHDAQPVLPFELFQNFARGTAHRYILEKVERAVALLDGALILLRAEPKNVLELLKHLPFKNLRLAQVDERVQEAQALLFEQVAFLGERGLHSLRSGRDGRAGAARLDVVEGARQAIDHREENDIKRLLGVYPVQQVMHVRNPEFARETRIDRAALRAFLIKFLAGEVAIYQVLCLDPETGEVSREDRRLRVHVQYPRHSDADLAPLLHQRRAVLL